MPAAPKVRWVVLRPDVARQKSDVVLGQKPPKQAKFLHELGAPGCAVAHDVNNGHVVLPEKYVLPLHLWEK